MKKRLLTKLMERAAAAATYVERSNTNCRESLHSICCSSNTVVAAAAVAPAGSGSRKGKKPAKMRYIISSTAS
jgi:hypothetical protein